MVHTRVCATVLGKVLVRDREMVLVMGPEMDQVMALRKAGPTVPVKDLEMVQLKALRMADVMDQGWDQGWGQAMVHGWVQPKALGKDQGWDHEMVRETAQMSDPRLESG
jgi:hypothetical protein